MTPEQLWEHIYNKFKDRGDDFTICIGSWEPDKILGPPHRDFHSVNSVTVGYLRKMLKKRKNRTKKVKGGNNETKR